jgi:Holliday junction resolvase
MGKAQRNKGHGYEREIVNDLKDTFGIDARRNLTQTRDSGGDILLEGYLIECKRRKRIAIYEWMEQAVNSCNADQKPIVVCRADGEKSLAIMNWDDFKTLLGNELTPTVRG